MEETMRDILEAVGIIIILALAYQFFFVTPEPEVITNTEIRWLPSPPIVVRDTLPAPPPIVRIDTVYAEGGEPMEYEKIEEATITYETTTEEGAELAIEVEPLAIIDEANIARTFIARKGLWPEFVEYRSLHLIPRDNIIRVDVQLPPIEIREITRTEYRGPNLQQRLQYVLAGAGVGIVILSIFGGS
jgi:hypothetical protein